MINMDEELYTRSRGNRKTVLWRPGNGRSVVPGPNSYRKFTHVVRTVHIYEALDVCVRDGMEPRPIQALSILNCRRNLQRGHVIRVLWFGIKNEEEDEDTHDWYGSVEFSLPITTVLQRWKNCYLVEFMTAHTHTASRVLLTNRDYSGLLPSYDPTKRGGPWLLTNSGSYELTDCLRFNNEGYNKHGHTLEMMIEVTHHGMRNILKECMISFRNHERARDLSNPHVCHRFQSQGERNGCPTPFTRAIASRVFFTEHTRLSTHTRIAKPPLSRSAERFLRCFLAMQSPRPLLSSPNHLALSNRPLQPHSDFAFNLLRLNFYNGGFMFQREQIFGREPGGVPFMATNEMLMRRGPQFEEHDDEERNGQGTHRRLGFGNENRKQYELHLNQARLPPPDYFSPTDFPPLPGLPPPPLSLQHQPVIPYPPPLHVPPPNMPPPIQSTSVRYPFPPSIVPPMLVPGFFQHSWAL